MRRGSENGQRSVRSAISRGSFFWFLSLVAAGLSFLTCLLPGLTCSLRLLTGFSLISAEGLSLTRLVLHREQQVAGMAAAAGAKVFLIDKYFYELQRYWDGEKKTESRLFLSFSAFCVHFVMRSADHNFLMMSLIIFPSDSH